VNFPNGITLLRILLTPVFIFIFYTPSPSRSYIAAAVFLLASLTDWFDGFIARRWGQVTIMGKLLDPIADKLLILSALILLVDFDRVAAWIAIVIIGRELSVTGLRAIASSIGRTIPVEEIGKYKTLFQMFALVSLVLPEPLIFLQWSLQNHEIGTYALWVAVLLAILSGGRYFYSFWDQGRKSTKGVSAT
jgi:CDP-diacylglycerol--glycerol-3-phosphate 3-phosphatidyltransferase